MSLKNVFEKVSEKIKSANERVSRAQSDRLIAKAKRLSDDRVKLERKADLQKTINSEKKRIRDAKKVLFEGSYLYRGVSTVKKFSRSANGVGRKVARASGLYSTENKSATVDRGVNRVGVNKDLLNIRKRY